MSKLRTLVDPQSEDFKENAGAYKELLEELRERTEEARRGVARRPEQGTKSAASCRSGTA